MSFLQILFHCCLLQLFVETWAISAGKKRKDSDHWRWRNDHGDIDSSRSSWSSSWGSSLSPTKRPTKRPLYTWWTESNGDQNPTQALSTQAPSTVPTDEEALSLQVNALLLEVNHDIENSNWCYSYQLLSNYNDSTDFQVDFGWYIDLKCNNLASVNLSYNKLDYVIEYDITSQNNVLLYFGEYESQFSLCFHDNNINRNEMIVQSQLCVLETNNGKIKNIENATRLYCDSKVQIPNLCNLTNNTNNSFNQEYEIDYIPKAGETYDITHDDRVNGSGNFTLSKDLIVMRAWWIEPDTHCGLFISNDSDNEHNNSLSMVSVVLNVNYIDHILDEWQNMTGIEFTYDDLLYKPLTMPIYDRFIVTSLSCSVIQGEIVSYKLNNETTIVLYINIDTPPTKYFSQINVDIDESNLILIDIENMKNENNNKEDGNEYVICTILETNDSYIVESMDDYGNIQSNNYTLICYSDNGMGSSNSSDKRRLEINNEINNYNDDDINILKWLLDILPKSIVATNTIVITKTGEKKFEQFNFDIKYLMQASYSIGFKLNWDFENEIEVNQVAIGTKSTLSLGARIVFNTQDDIFGEFEIAKFQSGKFIIGTIGPIAVVVKLSLALGLEPIFGGILNEFVFNQDEYLSLRYSYGTEFGVKKDENGNLESYKKIQDNFDIKPMTESSENNVAFSGEEALLCDFELSYGFRLYIKPMIDLGLSAWVINADSLITGEIKIGLDISFSIQYPPTTCQEKCIVTNDELEQTSNKYGLMQTGIDISVTIIYSGYIGKITIYVPYLFKVTLFEENKLILFDNNEEPISFNLYENQVCDTFGIISQLIFDECCSLSFNISINVEHVIIDYFFYPGIDLDLRVIILSPNMGQNVNDYSTYLGWAAQSQWPINSANPIITWGGDDTGTTGESILLSINNFRDQYPDYDTIVIQFNAWWYNTPTDEQVKLVTTWIENGTFSLNHRTWIATDYSAIEYIDSIGVVVPGPAYSSADTIGYHVATLTYNISTRNGRFS